MDILRGKTVTGSAGTTSVAVGLSAAQIINVSRQGEEKDKIALVSLGSLNGSQWIFIPPNRISFGTSYPFATGGETIHIIYKVTV